MALLAPVTPCKYEGRWLSSRAGGDYIVELGFTGDFSEVPAPGNDGPAMGGWWSVDGDKIQWVYNEPYQPWRPDSNRIVEEKKDEFVLIEEDGERTLFRIMDRPKDRCDDQLARIS